MKRIISFALIFIMALSLAACRQPKEASVDPTDAPKPTETVTQPTEEPTPAPTEAPTPEPTEAPTPLPILLPVQEYPLPDDPADIGDCIKDADVILHLQYGDGEYDLGYAPPGEMDIYRRMPESFVIHNGKYYILDSVKSRIIVWDDGELSSIDLPPAKNYDYYMTFAIVGDRIYASTTEWLVDEIYVFDMSGKTLGTIPLPAEALRHGVYRLYDDNGRLIMFDDHLICYELVGDEFVELYRIFVTGLTTPEETLTVGDHRYELNIGENTNMHGRQIYGDRVYCFVFEYDPNIPAPHEEMSFRIYRSDGELLGETLVDCREALDYPDSPMFITSDGTLYVMCLMQDGVYITRPNLRLEYTSHLGE